MSVSSVINEDKKYDKTHKLCHRGVDVLCRISNDKKTYTKHQPFLHFTINVFSGSLWSSRLSKKQQLIYSEIKRLRKEGLTYKQISNEFNDRGWTTTRGKKFLSSGVHSSEMKMEKRLDRQNRYFKEVVDVQVRFDETTE